MTGLRYVALADCARIAGLDADPVERAAAFADVCRLNALYMIERAGSGHPGTTFSSIDVVAWLHLEVLGDGDRYFSSKGHDVPGLYAVLAALGRLDFDLIHQLRRLDGLPGHPDVAATPEVVTSTGSLGMGVSKARGFVLADRVLGPLGPGLRAHRRRRAPGGSVLGVAPADREPQARRDHRDRRPQPGAVGHVGLAGQRPRRPRGEAPRVRLVGRELRRPRPARVRGHAGGARGRGAARGPIVANTRKGGGVSFMEPHDLPQTDTALYGYHSGAPTADEYERAVEEIACAAERAARAARRRAGRARARRSRLSTARHRRSASGSSRPTARR